MGIQLGGTPISLGVYENIIVSYHDPRFGAIVNRSVTRYEYYMASDLWGLRLCFDDDTDIVIGRGDKVTDPLRVISSSINLYCTSGVDQIEPIQPVELALLF